MNIFLEAPLQMAIYKNFQNCSNDIWKMAPDQQTRTALADNEDCYGRIPLSASIKMKNENFVSILLDKKYECEKSDKEGRTPFIYACISDNLSWMTKLFDIISLSNAIFAFEKLFSFDICSNQQSKRFLRYVIHKRY